MLYHQVPFLDEKEQRGVEQGNSCTAETVEQEELHQMVSCSASASGQRWIISAKKVNIHLLALSNKRRLHFLPVGKVVHSCSGEICVLLLLGPHHHYQHKQIKEQSNSVKVW